MTMPWEPYLTDADRMVITNAGYGQRRGLGTQPALLIIDLQLNYVGVDEPVERQQDRWPAGAGSAAWSVVRAVQPLIEACRSVGSPVIYTRNVQRQTTRFDVISAKASWDHSATLDGHPAAEIVGEVFPDPEDIVIEKAYASAFFGTPLMSVLNGLRTDTVLVAGVSTSGCVSVRLRWTRRCWDSVSA